MGDGEKDTDLVGLTNVRIMLSTACEDVLLLSALGVSCVAWAARGN